MTITKKVKLVERIKTLLGNKPHNTARTINAQESSAFGSPVTVKTCASIYSFFSGEIDKNSQIFYRYARQVQSRDILNVIAYRATYGERDYQELLDEIICLTHDEKIDLQTIKERYDLEHLLSLATLVIGGAESDAVVQNGVHLFDFVRKHYGLERLNIDQVLHYVEALGDVGRYDVQEEIISESSLATTHKLQVQLLEVQRAREQSYSESNWLEKLNQVYESAGFTIINLLEDDSLALLDRLSSSARQTIDGPMISVIMPTFSPGPGIFTALRSLLDQTWQNIEILVVDDGSPTEFDSVFDEIVLMSPRIRVIKQEQNAGAYAARNAGLRVASGEYVLTHDDDDWSHPDKLAVQVRPLLENDHLMATSSLHVRTTEDMYFKRINNRAVHAHKNYSSLMFKKEVVEAVGYWDYVNRGGDSEFESRLINYFGKSSKLDLREAPLSFSRVWAGSLTSGEMRRGYQAYSRQLYYHAYNLWHKQARKDRHSLYLGSETERPFPVPSTMEAGERRSNLGRFDVIYVADFHVGSKFVKSVLQNMEAAVSLGLRVGYTLLDSPLTKNRSRIAPRLFELQQEGLIAQVSHDDIAHAHLLVVYEASTGVFLDKFESSIRSQRAVVIYDDGPSVKGQITRSALWASRALQNLDRCFHTRFSIAPTSPVLRAELATVVPTARLVSQDFIWTNPVVQHDEGVVSPPSDTPSVGYHTFGNVLRWPSTASEFESIYHSADYDSILHGNLQPAVEKFGEEALQSTQVLPETVTVDEFLERIDFWIYYPDSRLDEVQPSAHVLQAMRAGKLVILPSRLEKIFETSAVYADISDVSSVVREYSSDPVRYKHQASLGQKFVSERYSDESYHRILARFLS